MRALIRPSLCSLTAVPLLVSLALAGGCESRDVESADGSAGRPTPVQAPGAPMVGAPAPDFRLWDLNGNPVTLSEYRGKVVFVNFWATWCGPCRVEMPAMERLYRDFDRRHFEMLAISTDPQGAAVTRPFQESLGLTFPILHDSDYRVGVSYGARTLPMTFLVDRRGIITHRIFGARDWESPEARSFIKAQLGKREGSPRHD